MFPQLKTLQQKPGITFIYVTHDQEEALTMSDFEAIFTADENEDLSFAIPKEGTNLWFDSMVIPKSSKNREAAEAFINFMCDPETAFNNADYIGYSTPHKEAKEMLSDEVKNDPAAYPSKEILDNCEVFVNLGAEMTEYYNEKWNELKASLN